MRIKAAPVVISAYGSGRGAVSERYDQVSQVPQVHGPVFTSRHVTHTAVDLTVLVHLSPIIFVIVAIVSLSWFIQLMIVLAVLLGLLIRFVRAVCFVFECCCFGFAAAFTTRISDSYGMLF